MGGRVRRSRPPPGGARPSRLVPSVTHSLRTTCVALGLPPALAAARLRLMRVRDRWVVYAAAPREDAVAVEDWIECLRPRVRHASANGIVRAEFDVIPQPLAEAVGSRGILNLRLHADSTVTVDVPLQAAASTPPPRVVEAMLTPRQETALTLAVKAGYYDLPRKTDLQWLADSMGIGTSSLSELLRRAESRLARAHIENTTAKGNDGVSLKEAQHRAVPVSAVLPSIDDLGTQAGLTGSPTTRSGARAAWARSNDPRSESR